MILSNYIKTSLRQNRFILLLCVVFASGFLCAQKTPSDSIKDRIFDKTLSDSVRAVNIIAYSFAWPRPPFDEMIPILDEGLKLTTKSKLHNLSRQILSQKIMYYVNNNRGIEAFSFCQEMIRLGESVSNSEIIANGYYLRGLIFLNYGMQAKAIAEEKKSLEFYMKSGNKREIANANYLIAWYSFNFKDYHTSLKGFTEAYNSEIKNKNPSKSILGEYLGWLGNTYSALKKFDSALYYKRQSIYYFNEAKDRFGYADGYRYLGNIYRNMKLYDSALVNYKIAYGLFEKLNSKDRMWLIQYFTAETYAASKNYKKSAHELDILLDTVHGSRDLLSLEMGTRLASKVYEKNSEYKKAINCYKRYIVYKDSSEKNSQQGALTELDAKLKFEQEETLFKIKQAEKDANVAREREKQAIIRNFFIGGFVVMAIFLIVIFRNYKQKKKANQLLEIQKNEIETQKKEIQDSINYAQNIQKAVLPETKEIEKHFKEVFILYKPKDVVSGDFFWYSETKENILVAAADCTGHGVPGAFMSMIGSYELNNSVLKRGIVQPSRILSYINISLKLRLKQNELQTKNKDGMDIVLCSFDKQKKQLQYAGANRPLYIIRNNEAIEVAPTKSAIGGHTDDSFEFNNTTIPLETGDCVYMYTDGYADQFGGEKNKKLTIKNFKNLLKSIAEKPMKEQYGILEDYFYKWKGNFDQLDDILVIEIRV